MLTEKKTERCYKVISMTMIVLIIITATLFGTLRLMVNFAAVKDKSNYYADEIFYT